VAAQVIGRRGVERGERVLALDHVVAEAALPSSADHERAVLVGAHQHISDSWMGRQGVQQAWVRLGDLLEGESPRTGWQVDEPEPARGHHDRLGRAGLAPARVPATAQIEERLLHTNGLAEKAAVRWKAKNLQPIGLHECRHTAATWLDAAGVSPKVASILMGHTTPDQQAGAASITLNRYTHVLPGATEKARKQLDKWLQSETAKGLTADR
jgi:hypothetical protein